MKFLIYFSIIIFSFFSCNQKKEMDEILIDSASFNAVVQNQQIKLYTLSEKGGITMQVTNYGGTVVSLYLADKTGKYDDIVLGHGTLEEYMNSNDSRFFGAIIGRYANRIHKGVFKLNGNAYQLPLYKEGHYCHGGLKGFDKVIWNVDSVFKDRIYFSYLSRHKEDGFPGNLRVKASYKLNNNSLIFDVSAVTDIPTPVNISNHLFLNLNGQGSGNISDHIVRINADNYTVNDNELIPTGEIATVIGTPLDFRVPKKISEDIFENSSQLRYGIGYDHNFVLNRQSDSDLEFAASVLVESNGRYMEIWTTKPGLQMYTSNNFDGKIKGKNSKYYEYRGGVVFDTQYFPDSPNHSNFPNSILTPGNTYHHTTEFRFGLK